MEATAASDPASLAAAHVTHHGGHAGPLTRRALALTSLGALGVVYGDIGTSPLYAMKECLAWHPDGKGAPHAMVPVPENVLGILSCVLWALILVICIKYLVFVLRADNKGEGGILALAALIVPAEGASARKLALPLLLALFGAGLLFGDGIITPAITTLGAMEGISEQSPALAHLVVPITIGILVALFLVQRHGTGRLGHVFGWVMLVWFIAIGIAGASAVAQHPGVLNAINPYHAGHFLLHHGWHGFLTLGLVFLAVTGGEALYADMGHFGKVPIRIAWFAIAMPGLVLNYFGQGAVFLAHEPGTVTNPFYELVDGPMLIPMVVLATLAAVIASQALISGVFSLTRQAMQLGFWPRVSVKHTSATAEGQIYIPEMNYLMMVGAVALVLQFRSSSALAAAYGIAVTGTMGITTYLFYLVARQRWQWSRAKGLAFLIPFLAIDLTFLIANATKIADGGWFPLAVGVLVFAIMTTWWRGRLELARMMEAGTMPEALFLADPAVASMHRVKGTAVFMSSTTEGVPNVVLHHVKHNQVLHKQVVLLSVITVPAPWATGNKSLEVKDLGQGFFRVIGKVGFMQTPDVPRMLQRCAPYGLSVQDLTTTYYLGRQTLLTGGKSRMARWRKALFAFLGRNSRPPTAFFNLPPNRVVELGLQIEM